MVESSFDGFFDRNAVECSAVDVRDSYLLLVKSDRILLQLPNIIDTKLRRQNFRFKVSDPIIISLFFRVLPLFIVIVSPSYHAKRSNAA